MVKRNDAINEHWRNWQKRHRAPRAIDVLVKTRTAEAKKRAEEKSKPFSVFPEDVKTSVKETSTKK